MGHLVQTPCWSRVTYSRLHRTWSRQVLNISREGDSTTSLGSPGAWAVAAVASWLWFTAVTRTGRSQCRLLSRRGQAAGYHSLLQVITPVNGCQFRGSSVVLKSAGCLGFLIKSHTYKLVRTSSFKPRRLHLSRKLKRHPNCWQVETNLYAQRWRKRAKFFLCVTCKYTTNRHLVIFWTSFKKVIALSFPSPSFNFCSQPSQSHSFRNVIAMLLSCQKSLPALGKLLTRSAALSWAALKPRAVRYRLLGLAARTCIYLLKVLYKSIPCFWTQVNRNNSETQPTTTATLNQHFQGIDFWKSIFSWHYSHNVDKQFRAFKIANKYECACTCVCTSAHLWNRKSF